MNVCDQRDFLEAYIDGDLGERDARRIEDHVALCAGCASELALHRRVVTLARALPLLDPSDTLTERILDRVLPSRARRRAWIRRASFAYAGALATCLASLGVWALHPGSLVLMSALGGIASRRLVQMAVFTLNAGSSALLDLANGWGLVSSTGAHLAPFGRVLAKVIGHPGIVLTLWLAGLACAVLLWWMRPRPRQGERMRHVAVLGF